jgi:type I restriction enzyme S subunit
MKRIEFVPLSVECGATTPRPHWKWWALDGKIATDTKEHINQDGISNSAGRVLPAGTVVLSRAASVGFVTIMGRPMRFLTLLFQRSRVFIRSLRSGAVHKSVYVPTVEEFCAAAVGAQMRWVERARAATPEELSRLRSMPGTSS